MKFIAQKYGQLLVPTDASSKDAFNRLKNGMYNVTLTRQRDSVFHRRYFALLNFAFEHWQMDDETFKNFEVFRKNIAILAGFYDQAYDLNGNIVLTAKSINFAAMDDIEFEGLYDKTVDVVLQHVLKNYTKDDLERVVLECLGFAA